MARLRWKLRWTQLLWTRAKLLQTIAAHAVIPKLIRTGCRLSQEEPTTLLQVAPAQITTEKQQQQRKAQQRTLTLRPQLLQQQDLC